ncbi:hypothetical protein YC2023_094361 [Brassica napus]
MEPGGCSQGESRPEGVESDRRERWAQSGWVKVTAGSSPYAHKAQLDEFPTCLDFQDTLAWSLHQLQLLTSSFQQYGLYGPGTRVRELAHGSDWLMIVQDRLDVAGKKETKAGYVSGQRYGQIHKAVWSISSQAFPHPIRSIQPATNTPRPDPERPFQTRLPPLSISYP